LGKIHGGVMDRVMNFGGIGLVFAVAFPAGLGNRINALGVGHEWRRAVEGEFVDAGCELDRAVEKRIPRDLLAGVCGEAAHRSGDAGFDPAFHFVKRRVVADGVGECVPLVLIRIALGRGHLGGPLHALGDRQLAGVNRRR